MNLSSRAARRLRLAAVVMLLVHPAVAGAQSAADQATAEALFADGRRLLAQGHFAEACAKLAESQQLDPAIGTLLNLADCYEKGGQTASAWARFREAAEVAHRAGDGARERVAKQRAAALEARLSRLTITVPAASEAPGLEVKRDGTTMGRPVWGTAAPVDPGQHRIEATAPGKKPWSTTVTLDASRRSMVVSVPQLEDAPVDALAPRALAAPAPNESDKAPPGRGQKVAGAVIAGTGLAAVGAGALFGLLASAKKDESNLHCNRANLCDQRGVDLRDEALGNATISTVTFIVGAAVITSGAVLWFTAPSPSSKDQPRAGLRAAPYVGLGSAGATLGGEF